MHHHKNDQNNGRAHGAATWQESHTCTHTHRVGVLVGVRVGDRVGAGVVVRKVGVHLSSVDGVNVHDVPNKT